MPMLLSDRYRDALDLMFELHRAQSRRGSGVPYVAHLLGVSSLALEHGADEDEAIAALLHDAAEDQGGEATLSVIRRRFGDRVADIVAGCSDSLESAKPPWRERKERYLRHLASASSSVHLVSGCDKLYNARCILADHRCLGAALWPRFSGGRDGTLWYYRSLARIFAEAGSPVAGELNEVVAAIDRAAAGEGGGAPAS
jgi:(p)ppGpp synthase/HD superfamily hydrolase